MMPSSTTLPTVRKMRKSGGPQMYMLSGKTLFDFMESIGPRCSGVLDMIFLKNSLQQDFLPLMVRRCRNLSEMWSIQWIMSANIHETCSRSICLVRFRSEKMVTSIVSKRSSCTMPSSPIISEIFSIDSLPSHSSSMGKSQEMRVYSITRRSILTLLR